jgi:hypothetical protein
MLPKEGSACTLASFALFEGSEHRYRGYRQDCRFGGRSFLEQYHEDSQVVRVRRDLSRSPESTEGVYVAVSSNCHRDRVGKEEKR